MRCIECSATSGTSTASERPSGRSQPASTGSASNHGPEFRPLVREFDVAANRETDLNLSLERWTDPTSRGWHSGENHIHANYGYGQWYSTPATMLAQCAGEDLHVCNFVVVNSDTDGIFDREFFRGRLDSVSTDQTLRYWNQEFLSTI